MFSSSLLYLYLNFWLYIIHQLLRNVCYNLSLWWWIYQILTVVLSGFFALCVLLFVIQFIMFKNVCFFAKINFHHFILVLTYRFVFFLFFSDTTKLGRVFWGHYAHSVFFNSLLFKHLELLYYQFIPGKYHRAFYL